MAKIIYYDKEAREKLLKGIDAVADVVKETLGPSGMNIAVEKKFSAPQILNDGVSIAKEITLKDPVENMGCEIIKNVSSLADKYGDGTTTASVLAQAQARIGVKKLEDGANGILMRDGINQAVADVVEYLKEQAIEADDEKLEQVAYVSCGCNQELGSLIAEALRKSGRDGVITIAESKGVTNNIKVSEGLVLDKGYNSPYFVTDQEKMECVLQNPIILTVDKKLTLIQELVPTLNYCAANQRPLLIISEDTTSEALATLVMNKLRGVINVCCIKAPGFGNTRTGILEDVCVLTGGKLWTEDLGISLDTIDPVSHPEFFGKAAIVKVTQDNTTVVVAEKAANLDAHINSLKTQLQQAENDYDKEKLKERIAKLHNGVVIIELFSVSEIEAKERKLRAEDAVNAVKSAVDGIVQGGGFSLIAAQKHFESLNQDFSTKDFADGYHIVIDSLSLPTWQIAENTGKDGDEVVAKCKETGLGYNALTNTYENLIDAGIVDPVAIVINSLKSAAAVVGTVLTTKATICDEPEDKTGTQSLQPAGLPMGM